MKIANFNGRIINIDKVSTIKCDKSDRIYFNMNFSIQMANGAFIQDYVYVKNDDETYSKLLDLVKEVPELVWYDNFNKIVNLKNVSSLKYDEENYRVILNLSNPHTYEFSHGKKVLSEFIYIEDVEKEDFDKLVTKMENL